MQKQHCSSSAHLHVKSWSSVSAQHVKNTSQSPIVARKGAGDVAVFMGYNTLSVSFSNSFGVAEIAELT